MCATWKWEGQPDRQFLHLWCLKEKAAKTFFDKPKRSPCNLLCVLLDLMGVIRNAAVGRESLLWERERWKKAKEERARIWLWFSFLALRFKSWSPNKRSMTESRATGQSQSNGFTRQPTFFPSKGQPTCRLLVVLSAVQRGCICQEYEHSLWNSSETWAKSCSHIRPPLRAAGV